MDIKMTISRINNRAPKLLLLFAVVASLLFGVGFKSFAHALVPSMSTVSAAPLCPGVCANNLARTEETKQTQAEDTEPEPDSAVPWYAALVTVLPAPKKLGNLYTTAATLLRPPDLVTLYANFRL